MVEPNKLLQDADFVDENETDKVEVMLNAVGRASQLKNKKVQVKRKHTFQSVITFIKNQLEKGGGLGPKDSIFLYINQSFSPSPNERMADLYDCFKVQNMLIVNYAVQEAWG